MLPSACRTGSRVTLPPISFSLPLILLDVAPIRICAALRVAQIAGCRRGSATPAHGRAVFVRQRSAGVATVGRPVTGRGGNDPARSKDNVSHEVETHLCYATHVKDACV